MVWVRSERALANSSTCRAPPAAMLRSSSQNTRMRMVYRRLLGGKPLSQAIGEVCPAKPLFNKAPSNGCHADLPVRIVQEYQHRRSQCDSGLLKKRGGDRGDRAGDHGPSAGKVIKDFDRRRFAPVPSERSHTERRGTNPRGNLLIGYPAGPGNTRIQCQTICLLLQLQGGFSVTNQK